MFDGVPLQPFERVAASISQDSKGSQSKHHADESGLRVVCIGTS